MTPSGGRRLGESGGRDSERKREKEALPELLRFLLCLCDLTSPYWDFLLSRREILSLFSFLYNTVEQYVGRVVAHGLLKSTNELCI